MMVFSLLVPRLWYKEVSGIMVIPLTSGVDIVLPWVSVIFLP